VEGVTSIITLIEACTHPQREGRTDLVEAYERALLHSRQVHVLPVALHNIRVPDALQIATAMEARATAFVTNDRRLARVHEIQVMLLDEYIR
jgi:predicted nucleic acid-binding protein